MKQSLTLQCTTILTGLVTVDHFYTDTRSDTDRHPLTTYPHKHPDTKTRVTILTGPHAPTHLFTTTQTYVETQTVVTYCHTPIPNDRPTHRYLLTHRHIRRYYTQET